MPQKREPTDYEKNWPALLPQWCRDKAAKFQATLDNKDSPPPEARAMKLQADIRVLERIAKDYEGRGNA